MIDLSGIPILGPVAKFVGAVVCHTVSLPPEILGQGAALVKKVLAALGVCS